MGVDEVRYEEDMSPPTRGAWIEIRRRMRSIIKSSVAPHTGGVD